MIDLDEDYAEPRWIATGFVGAVLHFVVFTEQGDNIRIISLRLCAKLRSVYSARSRCRAWPRVPRMRRRLPYTAACACGSFFQFFGARDQAPKGNCV